MKQGMIAGIYALLAICLLASAAAQDVQVTGDLNFGSDSQPRSNPEADIEEAVADVYFSDISLTMTNTGTTPITGLAAFFEVTRGVAADYAFTVTDFPATIAAGASSTFTVKARVPKDFDAIDENFNNRLSVGNLRITGTRAGVAIEPLVKPITAEAQNFLIIDDIDVCFGGNCKNANDGDDIKDIKPGDVVDVNVILQNDYSDSEDEDLDIEDVKIEIRIDDRDARVNERETLGDIGSDSDDEQTVTFDIDEDADDGTVKMIIEVTGTDQNGALMGEKWTVDLDIVRERHDLPVDTFTLSPSTLSCNAVSRTVQADVTYRNNGRNDEDEVTVEIQVPELGIVVAKHDLVVDKDDSETTTLPFSIPQDAEAGVYEVQVKTFYDRVTVSDVEEQLLTVPECDIAPKPAASNNGKTNDDSKNNVVVVSPPVTTPSIITTPIATPPPANAGDDSAGLGYVIGLGAVVLVLIIVLVVLMVVLFRRRH